MRLRSLALALIGISLLGAFEASAGEIPDLVGTWKAKSSPVYIGQTGHFGYGGEGPQYSEGIEFTYAITEQKDNEFSGGVKSAKRSEMLIGSIAMDGKTAIAVDDDGQYNLTLRDEDTIDACTWQLLPGSRIATCYQWKRVK